MLKYVSLGLVVAMPTISMADPIAAGLSATFGDAPNAVSVDVADGTVSFSAPTTLSVAAASGERVTASAVATVVDGTNSSGALAAATTLDSNIIASVEATDNVYESFVTFGPNAEDLQASIDALEEALGVAEGDIEALQTAVAALEECTEQDIEGTASQSISLGIVGTLTISADVTGTTVCVDNG